MNRSKLLIAMVGGTAIVSFAQLALATDAAADAKRARDTQYKVAMVKCNAEANTSRTACVTAAKSARETSKPAPVSRKDGIPTDAQGRVQFDP